MGIAECNMMGYAAGYAASGAVVFASTFAAFAAGRAYAVSYTHLDVYKRQVSNSKPDFFPTPQATWERFLKMAETPISKTTIIGHILISLKRVLTALVLAVASGIGIGLIMGWSKKMNAVLGPIDVYKRQEYGCPLILLNPWGNQQLLTLPFLRI